MNKIIITNKGHILPEDLMLIGSSTKRGDSDKIGMFGSGWKYALAWFLRNDIPIEIYSGERKIDISTTTTKHRDNLVEVITVDGEKTSLTTEMGPKWTGWMALREVISNAIDEGSFTIDIKWNPEIDMEDDITKIVIPTNNELSDIMMNYEHYFAFDRKTNYVYPEGRVFVKTTKTDMNVYRKGIRCFDDKYSTFIDFDFNDIEINESRLTQYYKVHYKATDIMNNDNLAMDILIAALKSENDNLLPDSASKRIMFLLQDLSNSGHNFHCPMSLKLQGIMGIKENSIRVPDGWWPQLKDAGLVKGLFDFIGPFKFMKTDAFDTKGIEYYLKGIKCEMNVQVGKFDDKYINVKVKGNEAYVNESLEGSDRQTAAYIIKNMSVRDIAELLD